MTRVAEESIHFVDEEEELAELLEEFDEPEPDSNWGVTKTELQEASEAVSESISSEKKARHGDVIQWATGDGVIFTAAGEVAEFLPPGVYSINQSPTRGLYFERMPVKTEGLLTLPSSNLQKVIAEIEKFWDREDLFKQYSLPHKRGILLWGPPGCGKSSCVQLLMRDVISRNGVIIDFDHPSLFSAGYRVFRRIQPDTPVVVIMEDLDAIIESYSESTVLNILDGIEKINQTVFVATTNYPEKLGKRIVNRPSRFDKRFKIGFPKPESRRLYLEFLGAKEQIPIEQWVKDTDGFTLAHIKELFVAVIILGDPYKAAVKTLKAMSDNKIGSYMDDDPSEDEGPVEIGGYA